MNYRHHFHAGNFADVFKHVLLLDLVRRMQRKETPFLYIDTHAGRGRYDLTLAGQGDSLARKPEHPDGVGRILRLPGPGELVSAYASAIRRFDRRYDQAASDAEIRYYPGSPWLVKDALRPQDRMHLCEKHPEEFDQLDIEFGRSERVSLHPNDGYNALRAALPPRERRALVLIDPPFEDKGEYARILDSVEEGLRRLPGAVIAIWYPLTNRASMDRFCEELVRSKLPPTLLAEIAIAPETSSLRMRGCGLVVINPPWQAAEAWEPALRELASVLAVEAGAGHRLEWLVPEARS